MEVRLEQKQRTRQVLAQKQRLAPVLRESLKMLSLSLPDLRSEIDNQLMENPVLEIEENETADETADLIDFLINQRGLCWSGSERRGEIDNVRSPGKSIYEDLTEQINLMDIDKESRSAAEFIIGNLDRNGYLAIPLEDLALISDGSLKYIKKALRIVQSLDPPGVGARNLKECLANQARAKGDEDLADVIEVHLIPLSEGRFGEVAEALQVNEEDVRGLLERIRLLNPRPGLQLGADLPSEVRYLEPDLQIREEKGLFYPVANSRTLPRVRISRDYLKMFEKARREGRESIEKYLAERLESAVRLTKCIEKRGEMLERIGYALIELQETFFKSGGSELRPMSLDEVARRVGCHLSTISRASHQKMVATPFGNFPLSYFFSSGVGDGVKWVSSRTVKREIHLILSRERDFPLSDDKIRIALAKMGYRISRRTVTKYRKALGIPPAHLRKRFGSVGL